MEHSRKGSLVLDKAFVIALCLWTWSSTRTRGLLGVLLQRLLHSKIALATVY
ncbi:hypothetical protein DsansV1_C42g0238411 [Dioscorea sansibarensis]